MSVKKARLVDANVCPCKDCLKNAADCFARTCPEFAEWITSTVEAVEVVLAHWIPDDDYDICSNCNNPIVQNRMRPDRRCKNCGAYMNRGESYAN